MRYTKETIESFHEKGLMWLLLGTLISSDSLLKLKDYKTSIDILNDLVANIPNTDIKQAEKDKYLEYAKKSLDAVQKEYNNIKKKIERRKKYAKKHSKEIKVTDGKFYL